MKVILDVHMEGLKGALSGMGWDVVTATAELGFDGRGDENILNYARESGAAVVTEDRKFAERLQAEGLRVAALTADDKAGIISAKLRDLDMQG